MRIGFVGGGTGGHFYPLIAVAEELVEKHPAPELYYFGPEPYDESLLSQYSIRHIRIPAGKMRRYLSVQNIFDVGRSFLGLFVALFKLYVIYPDVIFSKGSYTSVPILIAARLLCIPIVIHESDTKPGRANKLAKTFAKYIAISYDEAAPFFPLEKTALTGIPLRRSVRQKHTDAHTTLGIPHDFPLLYITGGSQGAERINNIVLQSLSDLLLRYRIFHQVGKSHVAHMQKEAQSLLYDSPLLQHYYIVGSVPGETVSLLLDAATLVITRAGSTTLFEIAAHAKPAIVVPIPEEISHDQRTNAYAYARSGAASVIEEKNLTPHLLAEEIRSIISTPSRYEAMAAAAKSQAAENAAATIAAILYQIGLDHGS